MVKHPEITPDGKYRGVIYERKNKITGKSYIGKTNNERKRKYDWNEENTSCYGGKKIMAARKEFGTGPDIWEYSVLEEVLSDTQEELDSKLKERETHWIREKNSVENGYNYSYGDGNLGIKFDEDRRNSMKGKRHTEETKKKISKAHLGRKHTEETKAKISKKLKGLKRTEEQRKAQSERMKGRVPKATAAAKEWVKKNGGYWKNHPIPPEARANMKKAQQNRGIATIVKFPDGHEETFPTMLDASKTTGIGVGSIHRFMKTSGTTRNGFKFRKAA